MKIRETFLKALTVLIFLTSHVGLAQDKPAADPKELAKLVRLEKRITAYQLEHGKSDVGILDATADLLERHLADKHVMDRYKALPSFGPKAQFLRELLESFDKKPIPVDISKGERGYAISLARFVAAITVSVDFRDSPVSTQEELTKKTWVAVATVMDLAHIKEMENKGTLLESAEAVMISLDNATETTDHSSVKPKITPR